MPRHILVCLAALLLSVLPLGRPPAGFPQPIAAAAGAPTRACLRWPCFSMAASPSQPVASLTDLVSLPARFSGTVPPVCNDPSLYSIYHLPDGSYSPSCFDRCTLPFYAASNRQTQLTGTPPLHFICPAPSQLCAEHICTPGESIPGITDTTSTPSSTTAANDPGFTAPPQNIGPGFGDPSAANGTASACGDPANPSCCSSCCTARSTAAAPSADVMVRSRGDRVVDQAPPVQRALRLVNLSTGASGTSLMETMVVGQRVQLQVQCDGGSLPNHVWGLPVVGSVGLPSVVKSYGLSDAAVSVAAPTTAWTSAELHDDTLTFFWGRAGTFVVAVSAPDDPTVAPASDTFTVTTPALTDPVGNPAQTCQIDLDFVGDPARHLNPPAVSMGFNQTCGASPGGRPGILWNIPVTVPAGVNGEVALTQVINYKRFVATSHDGTAQTCVNFTDPAADNHPLYGNWIVNAAVAWQEGDAPAFDRLVPEVDEAGNPLAVPGVSGMSMDTQYTDYVMFRPDGGIWVPLGTMSWTFIATVTATVAHPGLNLGDWNLVATQPPPTIAFTAPTHFPTFTSVYHGAQAPC